MKRFKPVLIIAAAILAVSCCGKQTPTTVKGERWSEEKAWRWSEANPWFVGFNYIPGYAINYTAMWDKTSYDPDAIDKELELAAKSGFNCVRVVLQEAVWLDDPEYFLGTLDNFLSICDKHGIKVMPALFDDCYFGTTTEPKTGKQEEPLEGWYAWDWSPSPGHAKVKDSKQHGELENYVKQVITRFKDDNRVFLWDLYNEPTNGGLNDQSIPLMVKTFEWGREVNPSQPLSIGYWGGNRVAQQYYLDNSDVITFHCYANKENTQSLVDRLKKQNRPMICTEWLNRPLGSTVEDILPIFADNGIGAMHWGFINGKTQTHLPWGHRPEMLPYEGVWQHDLYTSDHQVYNQAEIDLFENYARKLNK